MAYTVASVMGQGKGNLRLKDFVLQFGGKRRQSAEEQLAIFRGIAAEAKAREAKRGNNR